jgi:hypothetical protein
MPPDDHFRVYSPASEMFVRSATQGGYQYDDDENRSNEAQPP